MILICIWTLSGDASLWLATILLAELKGQERLRIRAWSHPGELLRDSPSPSKDAIKRKDKMMTVANEIDFRTTLWTLVGDLGERFWKCHCHIIWAKHWLARIAFSTRWAGCQCELRFLQQRRRNRQLHAVIQLPVLEWSEWWSQGVPGMHPVVGDMPSILCGSVLKNYHLIAQWESKYSKMEKLWGDKVERTSYLSQCCCC